jgi:hypothetical protein
VKYAAKPAQFAAFTGGPAIEEREEDANSSSVAAKQATGAAMRPAKSIDEPADAVNFAADAAKFRGSLVHTLGFAATSSGLHMGFRWIAALSAPSLGKRAGQVLPFTGQDAN